MNQCTESETRKVVYPLVHEAFYHVRRQMEAQSEYKMHSTLKTTRLEP